MIHYRPFINLDPPGLVDVWNESFTTRGAAALRSPTLLEFFVFSKPYFDPEGLIVAVDGPKMVGLVLAGFGPSADGARMDTSAGVVNLLAVIPSYRRKGVGAELASRAEDYLRRRGARTLYAGPMEPFNPFTFGLYGGSSSPGFLDSDAAARPFFEKRGYKPEATALALQRPLDRPPVVADARFSAYRQRYDIQVGPRSGTTWWQECVFGPLELHDYRLIEKSTGKWASRVSLWEMETYAPTWNEHAVGVVELETIPELRRKGLAKFLMAQILRHLHEQFFTMAEIQTVETHTAALNLVRGMGFTQVDRGCRLRREA
ncbi:MAG TPA: GNAT family N-acetyltransferase [Gemmataceae bacterium]|nr:GNAT family N-acetyltransferase [Gemmataceae bacterium]